jgi:transcriptional regulator with XRE-family HTH domain
MSDSVASPDYFSDDHATFGDRVAGAREAVGLSQQELAKRLGVKEKTMRAWEDDTAEPRANKLQMLSGVLNVSMRWLLTGEGSDVETPGHALELDADVSALLVELRSLRGEAAQLGEKIGRLEKRLRAALKP